MALEAWPSIFPSPTINYSLGVNTNVERTQMDSGYIRQRQRWSDFMYSASFEVELTDLYFQYFNGFVVDILNGGNDWFLMDIMTGNGMVEHTVRFQEGKFKPSLVGADTWKVSAAIDILETNRLNETTLRGILYPT